jgi:3-oxoacyl-[acyl-carrier protein] reductase
MLAGRVALVTGASRRAGIGHAVVRRLQELGANVFAHGWTPHDAAQPWGADLAGPGLAAYVEADFADPAAPSAVVNAAVARFGRLDILVANHARSGHGRLGDVTADELDAFLAENVRATLLLVKELAARHDGRNGGRVVLLTSGQHRAPMPSELAYAVSKGALQQATATLAAELWPQGITVNCVNPGPTATGWEAADPAVEGVEFGSPGDAARVIAWLCTDDARWVTGQTIDSEGGFRLS